MSIYAVDITFTDPEFNTRRALYLTPTDFLNRFQKLERKFNDDCLTTRTDLGLTDEEKDSFLKGLKSDYEAERAKHPDENATRISASIMTGKTHSFRRYGSIAELEKELGRPYGIQKGA